MFIIIAVDCVTVGCFVKRYDWCALYVARNNVTIGLQCQQWLQKFQALDIAIRKFNDYLKFSQDEITLDLNRVQKVHVQFI